MSSKPLLFTFLCLVLGSASLHAHGDLHVQIEGLTREIQTEPTALRYLKRGELQREHCAYDLALADYQKAQELDPNMAVVWFCRGCAYLQAGRLVEARAALDEFLSRKPTSGDGYLTRARVLVKLKEYDKAAKDYDRSIDYSKEPRPEHYLERAEALVQINKIDTAVKGLDAGMERLGCIPALQTIAIELETQAKRYDSALKRVDAAVNSAERKESWQVMRGEILTKAGHRDEARQAYRQALASIEALPARIQALKPTQELERKARAGIGGN